MPVTFSDSVHEAPAAKVPPDKVTEPLPGAAAADPPHVLVRPLGDATTSPAGKLSVKAMPVNGMVLAAGLTIVNDKAIEPFSGTLAPANAVEIAGADATAMLADAVAPAPPLADWTAAVVLVYAAETVPITPTVRVHELETARLPPVRITLALPATAVAVPPQVLASPSGVATCSPDGKVSVKPTPVSATLLAAGLVSVNVRLVVPFTGIAGAPNTFAIAGGATTMRVAEAGTPGPPSLDDKGLVTLFLVPAVVPVTFSEIMHSELATMVPAEKVTLPAPAAATSVPVQVLDIAFGEATTNPEGNVSVNDTPVRPAVTFWLKM
jgi:hypothetical protein